MVDPEPDSPVMVRGAARLTRRERWLAVAAAVAPILLAAIVLTPIAVATGASAGEVAGAALVYGGLLGLAALFVAIDRLQARQCPRCHRRQARGRPRCDCGYDLVARPRYACAQRHAVFLDPGTCVCGRRLERLDTARGVGRQVAVALKVGAWLLLFLVLAGIVMRVLEGNL